ncbi:hypothetical protein HHI36_006580, partial [Cryptolaemus montrouzieri]
MGELKKKFQRNTETETKFIKGLYFDGRKDRTLKKEKKGSRFYRKDVTEEHICLEEEPGSKFLGHVLPSSGSADDIVK